MINSDDNKKSDCSWAEVFKTAMGESTSIFVLVFGGVIVISSITAHAEVKIVLASFFTLFYAVINHYLAVFSKLESYRPYARGKITFLLYVFISLLLFVGWVRLTTELLLIDNVGQFRSFFKVQPYSFFWFWLASLATLYISWLSIIFNRKNKEEKQTETLKDKNESIDKIVENIGEESKNLTGKGGLDGLHNIARQNVWLAKIYKKLIDSVDSLNSSTSFLNRILIIISIIAVLIALPQFINFWQSG